MKYFSRPRSVPFGLFLRHSATKNWITSSIVKGAFRLLSTSMAWTAPLLSGLWSEVGSAWWAASPIDPSEAWSRDGAILSNSANSAFRQGTRYQLAMRPLLGSWVDLAVFLHLKAELVHV